jgi:hypothetical protein
VGKVKDRKTALTISPPDGYRNTHQGNTYSHHNQTGHQRLESSITAEKESTQEQLYDGKRIGNTQRQSGVCYDNERNDDRKCGHNNKDADS